MSRDLAFETPARPRRHGASYRLWRRLAGRAVFRHEDERDVVAAYLDGAVGTFVEVGAFDPIFESQTYHLEQAGWSGILIEPQENYARELRARRKARVFELACGAPEQHGLRMPLRVLGGLSTLRTTGLDRRYGVSSPEFREVPVTTLDRVLAEAELSHIDFLSVDVEGLELDVLRGLTFEQYRPHLILIEDFARDGRLHRFLTAKRYKRVRRTGNNSWYVPVETTFPVSLFGRWQLLRKYYLSVPLRLLRDRRKLMR